MPLIEDVLGVRASGSYELRGGYAESPTFPGKESEDELQNYRLKVLYKPVEDMTVKLMYQKDKVEDDMGKQLASVDPSAYADSVLFGEPVDPYNKSDYDMYNAFISYDFGSVRLESSTGYIDRDATGRVPLNGIRTPFTLESEPILTVGGGSESFSTELRAVSELDGPLQFVTGAIYLDAKNTEDVLLNANIVAVPPFPPPPPIPAWPPLGGTTIRNASNIYESESWAVFGEVSYDLMDGRLVPLVGLRYFRDDREFTDVNRGFPPSTVNQSDTFDSWNPRFNLAYKLTDDDLLFLNIAKGFRSGTFNTQAALNDTVYPNAEAAVDEDSLWSYEIGSKLNLADGAVLLEASVYYFEWTDQQINFSTPRQIQYIVNAGDTTGLGLDYGVVWNTPLEGLRLRVAGNVNSTEFDKIDSGVAPYLDGSTPGFPAPVLSRVSRSLRFRSTPRHWRPATRCRSNRRVQTSIWSRSGRRLPSRVIRPRRRWAMIRTCSDCEPACSGSAGAPRCSAPI